MSGKLVGMVFDFYPSGGGELLLAVKLADSANDDGTSIFPSVSTLAGQTRQSERTVQYQLRRMQAMGWLVLVREGFGGGRGSGTGRAREYRIHPDWVRAHDVKVPEAQRPVWTYKAGNDAPVDNSTAKEMGANFAPIKSAPKPRSEKEMGATAIAERGATAAAPYPSLPVLIPIPPNPPAGGARDFERFVEAWPTGKRTKLVKARAVFADLVARQVVSVAELVAAAASQAEVQAWAGDGAKRVPAPDRWLREQRWQDGAAGGDASTSGGQWQDSRQGIEVMGERLGIGRWDKAAFDAGKGEPWPVYRGRVLAAAAAQADQRRAA